MWEQIASNRRRSVVVTVLMGVLLIAVGMALGQVFVASEEGLLIGGAVALVIWLVQWGVLVAGGDNVMLNVAGAREIQKSDHPRLWNIVEEMTIASGLGHMPRVYIVDDPSPNAFATGRDPKKAAVAVTTGLLRILKRDELQGVVAHEIGHIKNQDVKLITTAGIMVGSIVLLSGIGLRAMWFTGGGRRSRSGGEGGGAQAIIAIVAILLLILSPILAQLIYFALSRRREYLADASGALFTRYPEGLASALEKLGGSRIPLEDKSKVTAPMYISAPVREGQVMSASSSFSTHPPIEKRVKVLRAMSGGADFATYEKAYARETGKSVIGAQSLAGAAAVAPREASAEPEPAEGEPMREYERAREASNAFLHASGYEWVNCDGCGAVLKIPPSVRDRVKDCPRCHASL